MPKKQLRAKEAAAIEYYTDPTSKTFGNWCQSCKKATYAMSKGWRANAMRVKAKDYIKIAINKKRAEFRAKVDITREYCVDKLQQIIENSTNERSVLTALSIVGDFSGFKRENAPNAEKEAAKRAMMTKEERELSRAAAIVRTAEEARGTIKLVKGA